MEKEIGNSSTGEDYQQSVSRTSSFSSIVEAFVPAVHTTKEIWRQPKLHRDTAVPSADIATKYNSHRTETWYELFYDLVFVAGAIQIGNFMKYDISIWGLFKSGLVFAVLRSTWDQLMFYQNKFDTKDIVHHIYYLIQAMCAFMMALHLSTADHGWNQKADLKSFAFAAMVSRLVHCVMYIQVIVTTKKFRNHFKIMTLSQIISSTLFAISAETSRENESFVWFWLSAIIVERSLTFAVVKYLIPKKNQAPPHFGHLSHRQATFILLILGEAIIALVQSNTESEHDIYYYLRGLMGFGLVFNVGDVYYQQQVVGQISFLENGKNRPINLWMALHLCLSIAILYFAVGLKLVFNVDESEGRIEKYEYLLSWSAAATLILIFFIRMTHKGITYQGKRVRIHSYVFRFVVSIICAVVPLFARDANATIGILFALSSILILQDLFSHSGIRDRDSMPEHSAVRQAEDSINSSSASRIARVDNGQSTTSLNTESFFCQDESFGRDKYILERSCQNSDTNTNIIRGVLNDEHGAVYVPTEKSRIYGGHSSFKDPLLSS